LPFIESIKPQSLAGNLQGFVRDIHTHDPLELRILDQIAQESTFATPKVQNGLGAAGDEFLEHGRVALRVEPCGQLRIGSSRSLFVIVSIGQILRRADRHVSKRGLIGFIRRIGFDQSLQRTADQVRSTA
jgi:hypothetical protein